MGWISAAARVAAGTAIVAGRQASAVGAYNKAIADRNFRVKVQEAERIQQQKEFDLARFDQKFSQLQAETKVATLKSGATLSGTALNNLRYNAEQSKIQKNIIEYNSKVAANKKIEEANFARVQGNIARQQARLAQLGTVASTGTSLLTMGGYI